MVKRVFVTLICLSLGVSFADQTAICFAQENEKQTEPAVTVESAAKTVQEQTPTTGLDPAKTEPKSKASSKAAQRLNKSANTEAKGENKAEQDSKLKDAKQDSAEASGSKSEIEKPSSVNNLENAPEATTVFSNLYSSFSDLIAVSFVFICSKFLIFV